MSVPKSDISMDHKQVLPEEAHELALVDEATTTKVTPKSKCDTDRTALSSAPPQPQSVTHHFIIPPAANDARDATTASPVTVKSPEPQGIEAPGRSGSPSAESKVLVPPTPASQYFSALSSPREDTPPLSSSPITTTPTHTTPDSVSPSISKPVSPTLGAARKPADDNKEIPGFGQSTVQRGTQRDKMVWGMSEKERRIKYNMARTNALSKYEAELKSEDKSKQKEAIRKLLSERVKSDWTWTWPRPVQGSLGEAEMFSLPLREDDDGSTAMISPISRVHQVDGPDIDSQVADPANGLVQTPDIQLEKLKILSSNVDSSNATQVALASAELESNGSLKSEHIQSRNSEPSANQECIWRDRLEWDSNTSEPESELPSKAGTRPDSGISDGDEKANRKEKCRNIFKAWAGRVLENGFNEQDRNTAEQSVEAISSFSSEQMIADYVRAHSDTINSTRFAKEFLRRKRLAEDGDITFYRKVRRKLRLLEEMKSNDGFRCFVERRNAWTGARRSPPPGAIVASADAAVTDQEDYEVEVNYVPLVPSMLPVDRVPMRSHIAPAAYDTIYDKVVTQSMTPSCPINLKDMTDCMVKGWKRDGTWAPPKEPPGPGHLGKKPTFSALFPTSDSNTHRPRDSFAMEARTTREMNKAADSIVSRPRSRGDRFRGSIASIASIGTGGDSGRRSSVDSTRGSSVTKRILSKFKSRKT